MDVLPDDAPAPRLCHLIKWPDFDGYGFNLHAERSNPGQFIGKIDEESPAQMAGLKEGDRIVEVNGVNISNENHRQVVERIKSDPLETKLLVVDADTDSWYKEQDIVLKSSQLNVIYIKTPTPRPQPDSPRAKFHHSSAGGSSEQVNSDLHQQNSLSPSNTNASSLVTSDFNEDSIEQAAAVAAAAAAAAAATESANLAADMAGKEIKTRCLSPPMSPDSGKGEEELSGQHVVTIEAEINRQSPQHMTPKSYQNQTAANEQLRVSPEAAEVCSMGQAKIITPQQANQQLQNNIKASYAEEESKDDVSGSHDAEDADEEESNVEPDSLSQPGGSMSPSRPATASSQVSRRRISMKV